MKMWPCRCVRIFATCVCFTSKDHKLDQSVYFQTSLFCLGRCPALCVMDYPLKLLFHILISFYHLLKRLLHLLLYFPSGCLLHISFSHCEEHLAEPLPKSIHFIAWSTFIGPGSEGTYIWNSKLLYRLITVSTIWSQHMSIIKNNHHVLEHCCRGSRGEGEQECVCPRVVMMVL